MKKYSLSNWLVIVMMFLLLLPVGLSALADELNYVDLYLELNNHANSNGTTSVTMANVGSPGYSNTQQINKPYSLLLNAGSEGLQDISGVDWNISNYFGFGGWHYGTGGDGYIGGLCSYDSTLRSVAYIDTTSLVPGFIGVANDGDFSTCPTIPNNQWMHVYMTFDNTTKLARMYLNGSNCGNLTLSYSISCTTLGFRVGLSHAGGGTKQGYYSDWVVHSKILTDDEIAVLGSNVSEAFYPFPGEAGDVTPPIINYTSYNVSSETGLNRTAWRTGGTVNISDTTPTVRFDLHNEVGSCCLSTNDYNYTTCANLNGECGTTGAWSSICTLPVNDSIDESDTALYIGCKDAVGNENVTSTSGALSINYTAPPAADSCTAPESGDWYVEEADDCQITTAQIMAFLNPGQRLLMEKARIT